LSKLISKSIRVQLFCAVLLSLAVGIVIFIIAYFIGDTVLNKTVYGVNHSVKITDRYYDDLREHVESEGITADNIELLGQRDDRGKKVYLVLYDGENAIYESPLPGKLKKEAVSQVLKPEEENPDNEYKLTLSDGTEVRAFIYYYSGNTLYFWMVIISAVLAFVAFSMCLLTLINRKVSYIKQLESELDILSGGQLDYHVTVNGNDELSALASGIDEMRRSIVNYQEIEKQMRNANSELITAMSHDLRTPLTSLLAYLEIIERKKYADEDQMYSLVSKSITQTMRIKTMADKLFEYFMVYATDFDNSDMKNVDADEYLLQMLGDYAYSLENSGMSIDADVSRLNSQIKVNTELVQRAFDNLYSNILKYADPEKPIGITCERAGSQVIIRITNGIASKREMKESTNIGLNTCKRIIELHGGKFKTTEENSIFSVEIILPLTDE